MELNYQLLSIDAVFSRVETNFDLVSLAAFDDAFSLDQCKRIGHVKSGWFAIFDDSAFCNTSFIVCLPDSFLNTVATIRRIFSEVKYSETGDDFVTRIHATFSSFGARQ